MAPPLDLRRVYILGKGHPDKRAAMQIIVTRQRLLNRTIVPIARDISNEKGRVSSRGGSRATFAVRQAPSPRDSDLCYC
jgi:hypothetical protein